MFLITFLAEFKQQTNHSVFIGRLINFTGIFCSCYLQPTKVRISDASSTKSKHGKEIWSCLIKVTKENWRMMLSFGGWRWVEFHLVNCCHDRWTVRGKLSSLQAEHDSWKTCPLHVEMMNNYVINLLLPHCMTLNI